MRNLIVLLLSVIVLSCTPDKYIGVVKAYDKNPKQVLSYAIVSGNTGGAFSIDKNTGIIKIASQGAINQSGQSEFSLVVSVTDDGKMWSPAGIMYYQDKPLTSKATITILKSAWTK